MAKRTRFQLQSLPDPRPDLPIERGPDGEGVGWWVPGVKHTLLAKYIDATRKAQIKFPERVLIDPFCGPGRIQVRGEQFTRDGGALAAWRQSVASKAGFTRILVGDIRAERAAACEARLAAVGAPVERFTGPASETVPRMIARVPPGALCLAYLDPYNMEFLSLSIIDRLAGLRHVDFAVHFSLMDLTRNVELELDPQRDRFSDALPGWRDQVPVSTASKAQLARWFFEEWRSRISGLGFSVSQEMPLVHDGQGRALYRLVFFSRHAFPDRIWADIAKGPNLSLPLE